MRKIEECLEKADSELFVIRGNHDDPKYFTDKVWGTRATFLRDYTVFEFQGKKFQCVGGGVSVDRLLRIPKKSWWAGEQIVYQPEKIQQVDYFLSHVPPKNFILDKFQTNGFVEVFCKDDKNLREDLEKEQVQMQHLFDLSGARCCYFGHMHVSVQCEDEQNRRYRCIDINESVELRPQ